MKKLLYTLMMLVMLGVSNLAYAAPVRFDVTVNPNPIKAGEFADVTIKAVDAAGNVDTRYTDGDIWIEIEWFDYASPDITLPGGGIEFFEPSDQGIKIFSKGLTIKKAGTYNLLVADLYDVELQGSAEITVLAEGTGPAQWSLTVTSPVPNSIESDSTVAIAGSTSFPNTPIVIFIDNVEIQDGLSDENGDFTIFVSGIQPGEHILKVNALDLDDAVVATSGPIPFTYDRGTGDLFLWLDIEPGKQVPVETKVTFTIRTAKSVTSAQLILDNGTALPAQKISDGVFRKQETLMLAKAYPIDVILSVAGVDTKFDDVDVVTAVDSNRRIITFDQEPNDDRSKVDLQWTYEGVIDYFKVRYGTAEDNLRLSITTSTPEGTLLLADTKATYYAQVFPVDENGLVNGEPSGIIEIPAIVATAECGNSRIEAGEVCDDGNKESGDGCNETCTDLDGNEQNAAGAPTCYPNSIPLKTKKINGKYYIYWSAVPQAKEYIVYRADQSVDTISQMTLVSTTEETMFEYPFDPYSEVDVRARYAVEAVCENDEQKQVGDMTPIKVGPEDTLLLVVVASFLIFSIWRLVKSV